MDVQGYVENLKTVQQYLLKFLEKESDEEENYQNLVTLFTIHNIYLDSHKLKLVLYLIVKVANNFHRYGHFFEKIEKILMKVKAEIKQHFSNSEIFKIFKRNKRILLFLIEESIITIDEFIINEIINNKSKFPNYQEYFLPEIIQFFESLKENYNANDSNKSYEYINLANNLFKEPFIYFQNKESIITTFSENKPIKKLYSDFHLIGKDLNEFNEKRKNGSNDDIICQMIQKDLIEDFIIFVKKEDYPLKTVIKPSIFETNQFLIKNNSLTLIEYATFYGSIQIFRYLYKNQVELTKSLWLYAIHGDNAEIITILQDNYIISDFSFENCIKEAIKCHHHHIVDYLHNNLITVNFEHIDFENKFNENVVSYGFRYYNFSFLPEDIEDKFLFYYACRYDYFIIVLDFLKKQKIDINKPIIK